MEFFSMSCYGEFCSFLILFTLLSHTHTLLLSNETDRHALLIFKNQIEDPLSILRTWNDSLHFCNWYGIKCDPQNQHVVSLKLVSLNLVGPISPSIANLTYLTEFNLRNNTFHGEIPQEIGRLSQLQTLNLSRNFFQGEIPTNLGHCTQLKTIDLTHNELVGKIPAEVLTSLSKLRILYLAYNNLTASIPPSVRNLSSLTDLYLSNNYLEGRIPDELGRIAGLEYLQIGSNELSGMIPTTLYNLSSLLLFDVTGNQFFGSLPPDLGLTLPNLQYLYVGENQFKGPIPVSLSNASGLIEIEFIKCNFDGSMPLDLGNIQGLQYLNLGRNQLGTKGGDDLGFLTSLKNCSNLYFLDAVLNNLNGALPRSIANFSINLSHLALGGNQIFGSIPVGIENLLSLTALGMDNNILTGAIPIGIGKLTKLEGLYLSRNRLSGQIPSSFGNLTRLNELYLYQNYLQGIIPSTLEKCHYLQVVELSDNNFTGTIPVQVLSLPSLSNSLNLSRNSFIGSLPSDFDLIFLQRLDISDNKLLGEIPLALGNCLSLEYLYMSGNFFQGTIPQSLKNLEGIKELDLSHNNLSGPIPKYLEKFTNLNYLNLSFNDLGGEIPKEGIFKNKTAISVLGNDKLCGGIPNLMLPPCPNQDTKKERNSLALRVILPVTGALVCLILISCFLVVLYWKRKSRKKNVPTSFNADRHLKISYLELLNATNGFSSTNLIGSGSFGSVYKGIIEHNKTMVAVKVLNLQQRGASKSFLAECEAMRNIRHRNLVKIITSCSSIDFKGNDFKALVLEFMPNGSLEMWLHPEGGERQSKDLTLIQRLDIAIDVASALDYLHHHCQPPLVHRDLKPNNVLLDDDMNARVADFGLAVFLNEASSNLSGNQNSSIEIKGSIGYLAPEYGMGGKAGIHGDVYSYGILLLEMFIGKRPTDDMFHNNLSLHQFAKMAIPEQVMEIIDPQLLLGEIGDERNNSYISRECLVSLVRIGVSCSIESPAERKDMRDVVIALNEIKDLYLGVGIYEDRQTRGQFLLEDSSYLRNYY
ncbi:putative receptor-like protein kinase At3g47110 isoform X1 [Tasmannia lanceolata]|uniref:putative receptor-like protein kinase At3g47110 isoform X1 n=1 Tax=Tasmannia lanceolata TaxID=3420 RepID=UPI0040649459